MIACIYIRDKKKKRCRREGVTVSRRLEGGAPRNARFAVLSRFLLSLALVHGLVSSPLLVECIRADGILLIEWIGHDPCRHPAVEKEIDANQTAATVFRNSADHQQPCVDLSYDQSVVTRTDMGLHSASTPAAVARTFTAALLSTTCEPCVFGTTFKRPREPVSTLILHSGSVSCLRI